MYGILKTLSYESSSYCAIPLGNGTYILAYGVAKSTLVGRGYLLNWREDCEGEGDEEKGGALLRDVYTTPASPWAHDTGQRVGAIGYGYKSPILFLHGSGKKGAFTQRDYLSQILARTLRVS